MSERSPTCVREEFATKRESEFPKLNSTKNKSSSRNKHRSKSPKSKKRTTKTATSEDVCTTPDTNTAGDRIFALKLQLEEMKRKIQEIEQDKQDQKEALYEKMVHEKAQVRQALRKQYAPMFIPDFSKNQQLRETQKIIQYLKEDNAQIRDQIQLHQKLIRDMKVRNHALELTNQKVNNSTLASLREVVDGMEDTNTKLVTNTAIYKAQLKKMKYGLQQRNAYHEMESNCASRYEACIAKALRHIGKRASTRRHRNKNPSSSMIDQVTDIAQDAVAQAAKARHDHLQSYLLFLSSSSSRTSLTRHQRKSLQLIAEGIKKNSKKNKQQQKKNKQSWWDSSVYGGGH